MPKTEYYVPIEAVSIITEQNRGMTQSVLQAIFPHIDSRIPSFLSLMGCCSLITEPVFLKSWCITCFPFCDLSCLKYHSYLLLLSFNCFFFFFFLFLLTFYPVCQNWFEFSCYPSTALPKFLLVLASYYIGTWQTYSVFQCPSHQCEPWIKSGLGQAPAKPLAVWPTENFLDTFINQFRTSPYTGSSRLSSSRND